MNSLFPGEYNLNISDNYFTFLKQISEDYIKYVTSYKTATNDYLKKISLNHEKYSPKLLGIQETPKNIKVNHIIALTSIIPKIIEQQIINIGHFIETIDSKFNKFEKVLKDKTIDILECQNNFIDNKNELIKKYRELDQLKISYMSNITITEETIHKYYKKQNNKKKIVSSVNISHSKINSSEFNYSSIEEQLNCTVSKTKKIEEEYKANIESIKNIENNYMKIMEKTKENERKILCEISNALRDLISDSIILLRNTFKLPLSEIDIYLDDIVSLDEFSLFSKDIIASYKKEIQFKPIIAEKYILKIFQGKKFNFKKFKSSTLTTKNKINSFLEEDLQEMDYLEEEAVFKTIKKMMGLFELLEDIDFDFDLEEEKLRCKYLTMKILSFAPINNIYKNQTPMITNEEVLEIEKMLLKKQNRVIFIQQLSQFRTRGIFEIPEREYDILSRLFNMIAKTVESDEDYDSAINIIILSQTYYITKNNKKQYLQHAIMNNELFKSKKFWETYVNYSINKEINLSKEIEKKNSIKKISDKEKEEKLSNIVFAQLVPITDNMIDFGLNVNIVEEIILSLIEKYKIAQELSEVVLSIINAKKQELLLIDNK